MSDKVVRAGYKQTEVGVIPEDWEATPIFDLGGVSRPPVKAGPFGSAIKKENYVKSGFKVYGQEQVIRGDYRFGDYYIDRRKFLDLESCSVRPGDILLSLVGTAGKVLLVPTDAEPGVINPRLLRISLDENKVFSQYLKYVFESEVFQKRLERSAQGGTMGVLNAGAIRPIEILIPTIPEQRAIAGALSDADGLIAALERVIAKKRDLKQAAMQHLLTGKTRLPGFSGEWEVKRLGDFGQTYGGLTGKTKVDFGHGAARYIPFMNVMNNSILDPNDLELVDVKPSENQNKAQKGDLFFNGSSETPEEVGMCALLDDDVSDTYLNSFCFGFRLKDLSLASGPYLTYLFRSQVGRELLASLAQGATRYNLSKRALLNVSFYCPSTAEQTAIAEVLSDMDADLAALEARAAKARAVKQGMMQQLLTGKVRLI